MTLPKRGLGGPVNIVRVSPKRVRFAALGRVWHDSPSMDYRWVLPMFYGWWFKISIHGLNPDSVLARPWPAR